MGLFDKIGLEDLDEDQRQLAELIGIDNYKKLVSQYGGLSVYIPKAEGFEKVVRNEKIRTEFNGGNYRYLATKYGLTEVRIRCIVSEIDKEIRRKPIDGQMSLFQANF